MPNTASGPTGTFSSRDGIISIMDDDQTCSSSIGLAEWRRLAGDGPWRAETRIRQRKLKQPTLI